MIADVEHVRPRPRKRRPRLEKRLGYAQRNDANLRAFYAEQLDQILDRSFVVGDDARGARARQRTTVS